MARLYKLIQSIYYFDKTGKNNMSIDSGHFVSLSELYITCMRLPDEAFFSSQTESVLWSSPNIARVTPAAVFW